MNYPPRPKTAATNDGQGKEPCEQTEEYHLSRVRHMHHRKDNSRPEHGTNVPEVFSRKLQNKTSRKNLFVHIAEDIDHCVNAVLTPFGSNCQHRLSRQNRRGNGRTRTEANPNRRHTKAPRPVLDRHSEPPAPLVSERHSENRGAEGNSENRTWQQKQKSSAGSVQTPVSLARTEVELANAPVGNNRKSLQSKEHECRSQQDDDDRESQSWLYEGESGGSECHRSGNTEDQRRRRPFGVHMANPWPDRHVRKEHQSAGKRSTADQQSVRYLVSFVANSLL